MSARRRGEANIKAKLTASQVVRLRERAAGGVPLVALAREVGVTPTNIGQIVTGRIWRHVGGPVREARPHTYRGQRAALCRIDGATLDHVTDVLGRVRTICPACERRKAGRCMECGGIVVGKSWRCERHKAEARRRQLTDYKSRNHAAVNRRAREAVRALDPMERRRRNAYKCEWRRLNRKKVLMQKRRARLAGKPSGYATREKYLAYHRAYRERHRAVLHDRPRRRPLPGGAPAHTPTHGGLIYGRRVLYGLRKGRSGTDGQARHP